jgi:DNA-binding transcriptional regulator YiaG
MTKCHECERGMLIPLIRNEEFEFDLGDGEILQVHAENIPVKQCDNCDEISIGSAAAKIRHDAICRAAEFPTPDEQKQIREQLGWSQQYLANLIGCGIVTVDLSERGRLLVNRNYYRTILAIRDCLPYRKYLEKQYQSKIK